MRTRHYVITEWDGPDINGNVTITAKDILDLADNKKALVPAPSQGKLGSDIDDSSLAVFDLVPAGIGSEYAASGRASMGSEIVTYTRSGDTITLTGRGVDGSEASSHDTDDAFQQCYRVESGTIPAVIADLLQNYAGVSASFLPTTDWNNEASRWIPHWRLTRTIAKPTGVTKVLGEILQLGVLLWWDDIDQEVKFQVNRPTDLGETVTNVTDAANLIEGTLKNSDLHDKRVSRVLFWHGVRDFTEANNDGSDFKRVVVAIDEDAESADEYNETRVFETYNSWLGSTGDDQVAQAVSIRLRNRYRDPPRQLQFDIDVKDEANLRTASLISLRTRALQDETGNVLPVQAQVSSVEEIEPGHKLRIKAQEWDFNKRYCFITEAGRSDYGASTAAEIAKGTYIVDAATLEFSDGTGPYLMF